MQEEIPSPRRSPPVLDAFIIEKIRREQERQDSERQPLEIEKPRPREQPHRRHRESTDEPGQERGVVIIEFRGA